MILAQPTPVLSPSQEEQAALKVLDKALAQRYSNTEVDKRVRQLTQTKEVQ